MLSSQRRRIAAVAASIAAAGAAHVTNGASCCPVAVDDGTAKALKRSLSAPLKPQDAVHKKAQTQQRHQRVLVTGASGFIASHIVSQLLSRGYEVHGTVRDANDPTKTAHLTCLAGAAERLSLYSADLTCPGCFNEAIQGCDAVIHTATPLSIKFGHGKLDGEREIYEPGLSGLASILDAVKQSNGRVQTFVLTSSMSAMAPRPEPAVKSEAHWSDADEQTSRGNWYGATKTTQERVAASAVPAMGVRFCAICPTMVLGPMLHHGDGAVSTMGRLAAWVQGGLKSAPNDSMSFIDVRDCAALHVAALERPSASGRYMCLVESLHWNDIAALLHELHPSMTPIAPFRGGALAASTQFDRSRQDSLEVTVRDTRAVLCDALEELRRRGAL